MGIKYCTYVIEESGVHQQDVWKDKSKSHENIILLMRVYSVAYQQGLYARHIEWMNEWMIA